MHWTGVKTIKISGGFSDVQKTNFWDFFGGGDVSGTKIAIRDPLGVKTTGFLGLFSYLHGSHGL